MAIELDHMFLRVAEHFIDLLFDCWFRLFFQLSVPAGYWRKELFLRIEISFLTCLRLLDWTGDANFRPLNFSGRPWQPFWRPNISHEVVHKGKGGWNASEATWTVLPRHVRWLFNLYPTSSDCRQTFSCNLLKFKR